MNTKVFITNSYFASEKTFGEILVMLVSIGLFSLAQLCLNSFNIFTSNFSIKSKKRKIPYTEDKEPEDTVVRNAILNVNKPMSLT